MADAHSEDRKRKQIDSGRVLVGALAGAAFAAAITVASLDQPSELARRSMYALVASIPTLSLHLLVTAPGHEGRHDVSRLMRATTVLGALAAFTGFVLLFESAVEGAGWVLFVASLLVAGVAVQASDRRGKQAARTPSLYSRPTKASPSEPANVAPTRV